MLKTVKKEVLKGCKIVFSRAFPTIDLAENQHLWKMAEQLGATCVAKLDSSVTHVVSTDVGTKKAQWAVNTRSFWSFHGGYWQQIIGGKSNLNRTFLSTKLADLSLLD